MGQYWKVVNLTKKEQLSGGKLFHFFLKNRRTDSIVSYLEHYCCGDDVRLVGDYGDDYGSLTNYQNLYYYTENFKDFNTEGKKEKKCSRFAVNYKKREYVDFEKLIEDADGLKYNTLLLLLAGPENGSGGGDYNGRNTDMVGRWYGSFNKVVFYDDESVLKNLNFNEIIPNFGYDE